VLVITFVQSTSAPFLSVQCQGITALKGGWMLRECYNFILNTYDFIFTFSFYQYLLNNMP